MLSFSRLVFGFLNVLALAFSIFQIVFAIIENHGSGGSYKTCNKKTAWLILWLSVFLLIMSLIGLFASCLRSRVLQTVYLAVAVVVTLVAVVITVFTFAALPKSSADATRQKALDKNWLHQFSPLLRETLVNDEDWVTIKNCLIDINLCRSFKNRSDSQPGADENFLRLGCCVPPERCGFVQENGTYKESPKSAATAKDIECQKWSKKLLGTGGECYDCDSCKAGYLAQFQADWRADGPIFIGIAVSLVVVTFLSLYILRIQTTAKDYLEPHKHERIYPRTPSNDHSIREISISCPEEEEEEEKHPHGMLGRIPMEPFIRGNIMS